MSVKGSLKDVSFIELMQLMHLSKKTGRIEVTFEKKWAMVIFKEGVLWHIEPRGFHATSPEDAIYHLIELTDGSFVLQRIQVLPMLERSVNTSIESLILEGSRRLDNSESDAPVEVSAEAQVAYVLKFKPGAEAKVRYVPQNVKKVLQAIDGKRSLDEVVKLSQLEAAQATQIIKELLTHNILEALDPAQVQAQAQEPTPEAAPPPEGT